MVRELQKMPEGVEIKAKITKGGKGAKKRKADGSVRFPSPRCKLELIYRMTTRPVQVDRVIVRRKRSRSSVHPVKRPLRESRSSKKKSKVRLRR